MVEPPMEVKTLLAKLSKFHWSPKPPETYVITGLDQKTKGVGKIAYQDYGAFNLAWAHTLGEWKTVDSQLKLVSAFTQYRKVCDMVVDNYQLREWVTLLTPKETLDWLPTVTHMDPLSRVTIRQLAQSAHIMEKINHV